MAWRGNAAARPAAASRTRFCSTTRRSTLPSRSADRAACPATVPTAGAPTLFERGWRAHSGQPGLQHVIGTQHPVCWAPATGPRPALAALPPPVAVRLRCRRATVEQAWMPRAHGRAPSSGSGSGKRHSSVYCVQVLACPALPSQRVLRRCLRVLRFSRVCHAAVDARAAAPPACSDYPRGSIMRIEVKNFMVRCRSCGLQHPQGSCGAWLLLTQAEQLMGLPPVATWASWSAAILCRLPAQLPRISQHALLPRLQTYKHAVIEPGPKLNLVLGPNGGGWAARAWACGSAAAALALLLCACCAPLGPSRASVLQALLRTTTSSGKLSLACAMCRRWH